MNAHSKRMTFGHGPLSLKSAQDVLINAANRICECGSDRETAEHFLLHCTRYQHLRKDTVEPALDILNCSEKSIPVDNLEVLLSPSIDGITKSQNITAKDLLFESISGTKCSL